MEGTVDSLMDYGAFIKLDNGASGLLHVSQLGPRGTDPSKVLKLHQQIKVRVLGVDLERRRISLGLSK